MNLFTQNSPYYHLLKYLLFLLKYPVYVTSRFYQFFMIVVINIKKDLLQNFDVFILLKRTDYVMHQQV